MNSNAIEAIRRELHQLIDQIHGLEDLTDLRDACRYDIRTQLSCPPPSPILQFVGPDTEEVPA